MMNWATIAPESRLFKGKLIFRWEVSPGLEHHCGTCAMPLHNARAKTSCLGKHVEPCYRFHQQLHFVGKSHECFGCNSSDEMHHNRHKEILKIIRQIAEFDHEDSNISKAVGGTKQRRASTATLSTNTTTDTSSETFVTERSKLTRKERKKAKKAGNGSVKDKRTVESFPREETDFISEAIHLSVHESKGAWEGTYVYDHRPFEDKQRAADNERMAHHISADDALSVKPPHLMTPRQRKVYKKFSAPIKRTSFRGGSRKFTPETATSDPFDGVDPAIFFRLGVEILNPSDDCKARKELISKLIAAVKDDLEIQTREEAESAMREEGFWRWAGRTAYHTILQTREDLDWATGQKKGGVRMEPTFMNDELEHELNVPDGGQVTDAESETPVLYSQRPLGRVETQSTTEKNAAEKKTFMSDELCHYEKYQEEESYTAQHRALPASISQPPIIKSPVAKSLAVQSPAIDDLTISQADDESEGWSVVKHNNKSSAKRIAAKFQRQPTVYHRARDGLTISLR